MNKHAITIIVLSSLIVLWPNDTYGEMIDDLENRKIEIMKKTQSIQQDIHLTKEKVENIKREKDEIDQEIQHLDESITSIKQQIRDKEEQMGIITNDIYANEQELDELNLRINIRTDLLKNRVRSLQENGTTFNYFDAMLESNSIWNLIDRISAISTIIKADKALIKDYEKDRDLKEQMEKQLKDRRDFNKENLLELEILKQSQQQKLTEKSNLMKTMSEEEVQLVKEFQDLEDESILLKAQEEAIKKEIENYKRRVEENPQIYLNQANSIEVTNDIFIRPTTGRVTSEYGTRWEKLHAGIDIGNQAANVPVVAVADGTVIRSYYSTTYGNVVFITHNIDGQIFTTVSAHLEENTVRDGDSVIKGQTIGYMGNTGRSFGNHLHFEIHKGSWNLSKSNSIDPRIYIKF